MSAPAPEIVTTDAEVFKAKAGRKRLKATLQRHDFSDGSGVDYDVYVDRGGIDFQSCDDSAALRALGGVLIQAGDALAAARRL